MATYTHNVEYSEGWDAARAGQLRSSCDVLDDDGRQAWMEGYDHALHAPYPSKNILRYIEPEFRKPKKAAHPM